MTLTNDSRIAIDVMSNRDRMALIGRLIGTHDEKGLAEMRYAFDKLNETEPPEVRRFLTLSTAHLSQAARHWMEANAAENALQRPGSHAWAVAPFMHGWMMRTPPEEMLTVEDVPFDLHVACTFARQIDCAYILFDADGEIDDTLPTFVEDEESTDGLTEEEKQAMEAADLKHARNQELQEIADGAYGDGPFTRGAAKRLLEQEVPEGGLHDELDAPGEIAPDPEQWPGSIHPEDGRPLSLEDEASSDLAAGTKHWLSSMPMISELKSAIADILGEIDSEIDQRQHSGNDEYWKPLQEKRDRLTKAAGAI